MKHLSIAPEFHDDDADATPVSPLRVASVPSSHVYIEHLSPSGGSQSVTWLPDPDPDDDSRSAVSRWWPPVMLEPAWVHAHAHEFDLFHLQFGFDARTPEQLEALVTALRDADKPFVYTVHDLRNPHHATRELHDAQLDVLIPAADRLITLTDGAAAEIRRRWGRIAQVLPHPHVVDVPTMQLRQAARSSRFDGGGAPRPYRVGVHVKSLRASMEPLPVIQVLADAAAHTPGIILQVDGHSDVLLPDGDRFDPELSALLESEVERGRLELRIHDFFSDAELWSYLASLDASVLPYRFGTHSGWLEACRDLGTAVIASDCGYYADQGPVHSYHHDERGLDADSLLAALRRAMESRPPEPVPVAARLRQRDAVAAAHLRLYRELLT